MRFDPVGSAGAFIIHETLPTLYETLGVRHRAPSEMVRIAYRKLAREYHPDVNPDPQAHERMAVINEAFEILSDPVRRMEYDATIGHNVNSEPKADDKTRRPTSVSTEVMHRHRVHKTPVYGASFTSRHSRLVTSSFDNELIWWSDDLSSVERRMKLDSGVVSVIQTVGEDGLVAAGNTEQSLSCWHLDSENVSSWRQSPKAWVCTAAPSPNGKLLAVGSVDNILRVLSVEKGRSEFSGISHEDSVTSVAWSHDSRVLASGSGDASVKLWDARSGKEFMTLKQVRSTVTSMAFSPSGRWIAVAAVDLSIRVFDLNTGLLRQKFFGHKKPVESLSFHPQSWLLASASRDGTLGLWNIDKGIGHGQIPASHQPLSCVSFNPKGDRLIAGGLDKVLRIWSLTIPN